MFKSCAGLLTKTAVRFDQKFEIRAICSHKLAKWWFLKQGKQILSPQNSQPIRQKVIL